MRTKFISYKKQKMEKIFLNCQQSKNWNKKLILKTKRSEN